MDSVDEGAGPPPEPRRVRIDFCGSEDRMSLDGDYMIPYLRSILLSGFQDSSCWGFTYSSVSIMNDLLAYNFILDCRINRPIESKMFYNNITGIIRHRRCR